MKGVLSQTTNEILKNCLFLGINGQTSTAKVTCCLNLVVTGRLNAELPYNQERALDK